MDCGNSSLNQVCTLLEQVLKKDIPVSDQQLKDVIHRIEELLSQHKQTLKASRTACMWFMYMDMINVFRLCVKAERTSNFLMHLKAISDMLPYFAASGHNLYTKSGRLYLQQMQQLKKTNKEVFQDFLDGHHTIRRSDRLWAGLSADLVIEQALMRSIKTSGGLTRGRGIGETQRTVWLLSMPSCVQVINAVQTLTSVVYTTSEQHKDCSDARQHRDHKDTVALVNYISARNPFSADPQLRNIVNGKTAEDCVNVDRAKEIGCGILQSMVGKSAGEVKFKRKAQAVTMSTKTTVKVNNDMVQIDPQLLFQRLVAVAQNTVQSLPDVLEYELTSVPSTLFDSSGLPRQAAKSSLADFLWKSMMDEVCHLPEEDCMHIIDGGSLLHHFVWPRGTTYGELAKMYSDYVSRKYGRALVVFDGYSNGPSTKDMTHLRRRGNPTVDVNFTTEMEVTEKKDCFLANQHNKESFISLLMLSMNDDDIQTCRAKGDADVLIVAKAIQSAENQATVVVGEDTDLLVLLLHHTKPASHNVFFAPSNTSKHPKIWDIKRTQYKLGTDICDHILFAHAMTGCDSTSRLFGIGKSLAVKKIQNSKHFRDQASVFCKKSGQEAVVQAGERAVACLYGGKDGETLDSLRHIKFVQKVAVSTNTVQATALPPTSAAAKYHSMRVHYQVAEWMQIQTALQGEAEDMPPMNPTDWGWQIREPQNVLIPVYTDKPPAPPHLLQSIRCKCQTDCSTAKCSCRKHGLSCSPGCGECRGSSCSNSVTVIEDEDSGDAEGSVWGDIFGDTPQ